MRTTIPLGLTAVLVLGLAVAAPAAGVDDQPAVPLMPGATSLQHPLGGGWGDAVVVSSQAAFVLSKDTAPLASSANSVLFTRSLSQDASSVNLGPATRVARASGYSMAEHDGTVAYLRRVDGRLVLRAPDGTQTMPAWGTDPLIVSSGPAAMSGSWLAAAGTVFHRGSGSAYDLLATVTDIPAAMSDSVYVSGVEISGDRVLFGVSGSRYVGFDMEAYSGIYTVNLGASGPVGAAVRVDHAVSTDTNRPTTRLTPVGFIGSRLVWLTESWSGTYPSLTQVGTVSSVPADTPGATPVRRSFDTTGHDLPVAVDAGDSVAFWAMGGPSVVWFDPASPATDLRSASASGFDWVRSASDGLLVYDVAGEWPARQAMVRDVTGRTITADPAPAPLTGTFPDVSPSSPFLANIAWLADLGITRGYADGTFQPGASVNRDAMAPFLYRFAGEPAFVPPAVSPFLDVATSHPFYKEIAWLAAAGISTGTVTPEGAYYRPGEPVSREAMAAFLYRIAGRPQFSPPGRSPFTDIATTHPFYTAIAWLSASGVSTGYSDGTFLPSVHVSREAMAAFLNRMHAWGWTTNWHDPS